MGKQYFLTFYFLFPPLFRISGISEQPPLSVFSFLFLSPVCPLMKPPQNRITISPHDSDSKHPHSFLRKNKVQASQPKAQLVSFKLALKTRYVRLRCVFSVCELNNSEPNCDQCNNKLTKTRQNRFNHIYTDDRPHDPSSYHQDYPIPNKIGNPSS